MIHQVTSIQPLLDLILTKKDLSLCIDQIDTVVEKIYTKDATVDSVLQEVMSKEKHQVFVKMFEDAGVAQTDYSGIKEIMTSVKEQLDNLPVLTITVAIEPSESFTEKVSDWLDQNLEEKVIFEFIRNPKLIGGAGLSFNGMAKNYSVDKIVTPLLSNTSSSPQP